MCYLSPDLMGHLANAVKELMEAGEPFTGRDVAFRMDVNVDRPCSASELRYRSSDTRGLFNRGGMPGWASMQVTKDGPVLYFKVAPSSKAGRKAKAIKVEMNKLGHGPL